MYQKRAERALRIIGGVTEGERIIATLICKRLQIAVKRTEGSHLPNGYAVVANGQAYILLKSGLSKEEAVATIAHELAHILLGHVGNWKDVVGCELPCRQQEREADRFARKILKNIFC